jgi:hypothetical protein
MMAKKKKILHIPRSKIPHPLKALQKENERNPRSKLKKREKKREAQ